MGWVLLALQESRADICTEGSPAGVGRDAQAAGSAMAGVVLVPSACMGGVLLCWFRIFFIFGENLRAFALVRALEVKVQRGAATANCESRAVLARWIGSVVSLWLRSGRRCSPETLSKVVPCVIQ